MSTLGYELREAGLGLWSRAVHLAQQTRRTSAAVVLVRLGATVAALAGLGVALPVEITLSPRFAVVLPIVAGVGLFPRTRWVGLVLLGTALAWVVTTTAFSTGAPPPWQVAVLAAAMYLTHSAAALAAVLPHDALVAPALIGRWSLRTLAVTVVGAGGGALAMIVLSRLQAVQSVVGAIAGSVLAAGLCGLLAWHLLRRG